MKNNYLRDLATVLSLALFGGFFYATGHAQLSSVAQRWGGSWFNYDAAAPFSAKDVEFALGLACGTVGFLLLAWLVLSALFGVLSALAARVGLRRVSKATGTLSPRFMKSLVGLVFGVSLLAAPGAFADEVGGTIDVPSPAFVSQSITVESTPAEETPAPKVEAAASPSSFKIKEKETMHGIPAQELSSVVASGQRQSALGQREVAVLTGDSLWEIVANHLGPQATTSEIHAEWPKWYERNKSVIGENPDLILPGTVLTNPNF